MKNDGAFILFFLIMVVGSTRTPHKVKRHTPHDHLPAARSGFGEYAPVKDVIRYQLFSAFLITWDKIHIRTLRLTDKFSSKDLDQHI